MTEDPDKDTLKEYQRLKENPNRYKGLDTSKASIDEIARYFARRFEKLYKMQFEDSDDECGMPIYENALEVTPAWTSADGRLATYRFYSIEYGGGVHGMMYENYITIDTSTGRVLGRRDLYTEKEFEKTMLALGKEIEQRRFGNPEQGQTADIGQATDMTATHKRFYEEYHGYYYPRAALLGDRVVFSYQPYDKGRFAEGILHFALPYTAKTR